MRGLAFGQQTILRRGRIRALMNENVSTRVRAGQFATAARGLHFVAWIRIDHSRSQRARRRKSKPKVEEKFHAATRDAIVPTTRSWSSTSRQFRAGRAGSG